MARIRGSRERVLINNFKNHLDLHDVIISLGIGYLNDGDNLRFHAQRTLVERHRPHDLEEFDRAMVDVTDRHVVPICLNCRTLWFNMEIPNCHCG